jgi:hypothetical protein
MFTNTLETDWTNIDLSSPCESQKNILEPYTFDILLLEIECNLPNINEATVKSHALAVLKAKYQEAVEILNNNLTNITTFAQQYRAKD